MGWVDREHIPTLEQDWRYTRLLNLTRRGSWRNACPRSAPKRTGRLHPP